MQRLYIFRTIIVVFGGIIAVGWTIDDNNAMNVIWHNYIGINVGVGKMIGDI